MEHHTAAKIKIPAAANGWQPEVGIVLGSGLGSFADTLDSPQCVAFEEIEGLPQSSVPGHAGRLLYGRVGDTQVVVAQGRAHLYEGWTAAEVSSGVRLISALGAKVLVLTNAAGAVNPEMAVGRWMMLADHLNLTGTTPLLGGANFHDMSEVYSPAWRSRFRSAAEGRGIELHEGVYAGLLGPQYETPAEVRMLQVLGADAVGMSTVLEAIQARALGMEVVGFSCLTNPAAGLSQAPLDHAEVLEVGSKAASQLVTLLIDVLANGD